MSVEETVGLFQSFALEAISWLVIALFCFILFYWSIVDLQCCFSFTCTAKWFNYIYTYIHSFSDSFLIYVITEHWVEVLVPYSRSLSVIYLIYSSVCVCVHPKLLIYPSPCYMSPLVSISLFSISKSMFLLICIIFKLDFTYEWYHTIFVFLWLKYLAW